MSEQPAQRVFRNLEIGDVVTVRLPQHRPTGHEQEGYRPAVVVGVPSLAGHPRFDVLVIAPFTSDRNQSWLERNPELYPRFPRGVGNLRAASVCLLDQARALDKRRVVRRRGRMDSNQYVRVRNGLLLMLGQLPVD